jgi:hypothetical protein
MGVRLEALEALEALVDDVSEGTVDAGGAERTDASDTDEAIGEGVGDGREERDA